MNFHNWSAEDYEKLTKATNRTLHWRLGMNGPYKLDSDVIDQLIADGVAGNYRLSRSDYGEPFIVDYIGRSDEDLAGRIKDHIVEGYGQFACVEKASDVEAYYQECHDFHFFGGDIGLLDNDADKGHPHLPKGYSLKCPVCEVV